MQVMLHGMGVALLPDYLVEQDLATGRVKPVWGGPVTSLLPGLAGAPTLATTAALWMARSATG